MSDSKIDHTPLIARDVSFAYNKIPVVKNLSLAIKAGEFVVILGPSGCGKSTLLNLLSGFISPDKGVIKREGVIRAVYQHDGLFPWLTVQENISMGLSTEEANYDHVSDLLKLIGLERFNHHYPHELSGGMRQRVELARALSGTSDILLMDEPFSSLDYQSRIKMRRMLLTMLSIHPKTVIFVTHDIDEAVQLADRVIVLSDRPTVVRKEFIIHVPHPRRVNNLALVNVASELMDFIGVHDDVVSEYRLEEKVNGVHV